MKEKQYIDDFEIVCPNCSRKFLTEDQDTILCDECWESYLENQYRAQNFIRLTKEYITSLLEDKN